MAFATTKDGTDIYKDWGPRDAQPIHFHHGWPLRFMPVPGAGPDLISSGRHPDRYAADALAGRRALDPCLEHGVRDASIYECKARLDGAEPLARGRPSS
ncbi:hypothetical protein GCM10019059_35430 [Camelimonas fluminis]|nr:hypothetical protein GCM10019059_35430 [Camelimonas fluminis]